MQVGGFHDAQMGLTGGCLDGKGVEDHRGSERRRTGEEGAAGNAIVVIHDWEVSLSC